MYTAQPVLSWTWISAITKILESSSSLVFQISIGERHDTESAD